VGLRAAAWAGCTKAGRTTQQEPPRGNPGRLFLRSHVLRFYVAADDYIYVTRIDATSLEADKQTQNDVQLSFGFGIPLGH
jgi:hypothetical protein